MFYCLKSLVCVRERERCLKRARRARKRVIKCREKHWRKRTNGARQGLDSRNTVISECFSALSACLTLAAGESYWRIRLVAFLWLLTSGDFGLFLGSNEVIDVCVSFCRTLYWLWSRKTMPFFWWEGCSCCGWSSCTCGWCSLTLPSRWKRCWRMCVRFSHELMEGN